MKHVIVGAGAAGISAAKAIREHSKNDEIVIISTDDAVYSRCMLHHYISGKRSLSELAFVSDGFFEENNIRWLSGISATGIDKEKKQVIYDGGSESFDKLLIASGAQSAIPPIEGLREAKGVYGLRDLPDAKAIAEKATKAENIVILGAGLVGIDAAYGLSEIGRKPLVIEMSEHILPVNLDANAAETYQAQFNSAGTTFKLSSQLSKVSCDNQGEIKSVTLSTGEELPCDLLIVATSTRPNLQWLSESGITVERGVVTDKYLKTSADDIYAAGDVTGLSGTWPDAMAQGETAAMNMCGVPQEYSDFVPTKCTMSFFGIPTLSVGQFKPQAGDAEQSRESKGRYEKVIQRDGIPVGVILQGDISRSGYWQYLIKNKINTSSIEKPIWKVSFADAYSIEANGEYKWAL